ncbi:MAG: hypothetical protein NTX49_06365 [Chlamydiae bacterium]|nr:hypothetical protein [Chlamydiota bacterium]
MVKIKGKRLIFSLSGLILISVVGIGFFINRSLEKYFISLPISYSSKNIPLLKAKINSKEVLLGLDFGSKYHLFLNDSFLATIEKKELGKELTRDFKGNKYDTPFYNISNLQLGPLSFHNVKAHEQSQQQNINQTLWKAEDSSNNDLMVGHIGRPAFETRNFLLDFPHRKFILCDDLPTVRKNGYDLDDFLKVPCIQNKFGIIMNFATDFGEARLVLDTGTTITMIRKGFTKDAPTTLDSRNIPHVFSEKFMIGGFDFTNKNLFLFDISEELTLFDGILGMDLLEKHILYLDRKSSMIYIK